MNQEKRYHPLIILHDIWRLVSNSIFFFIFLFIIQANSEFWLYKYGRYAFVLLFIIILLDIPVKWFTSRYKIDDKSLQLQRRLFANSSRTIPYENIQHVRRKTTLFHRIFNMTSLTLETNVTGDHSSVTFQVLTPEESMDIEKQIRRKGNITDREVIFEENQAKPAIEIKYGNNAGYTVHFTPAKRDIFKAALTSFSFIAVIPIAWSLISNLEQLFHMEGKIEGMFSNMLHSWSWWMLLIFLTLLMLAAVFGGGILTALRYGKYEIASDVDHIYISKGILEMTSFMITKANVQAVSVHQSWMKRILGLAEVKLICAGGTSTEELEVNTLYPFLPVQRAYSMIREILPDYQVAANMERLPKKALSLRMLRPSWFWMIATVFLFYFRPDFFGIELAWWVPSIVILLLVIMSRVLSFFQTGFTMSGEFVQFKTGGFTNKLFLSKRTKIAELQLTRNIIQQKLGLVSIMMSHRARPVKHTRINDVPIEWCKVFRNWYISKEQAPVQQRTNWSTSR
ncbi:PH domain-containing protein [Virgibacillus sp. YIM 98842]|uniref:PH domain-containing protein n=1 Tax=Virgibacillus sp. YIM 98842 TaxID=2663533 RepID=UPI0013DBA3E6|nr:PH domain-containing protein [Virgibacillus sp. YIM 98842]